MKGEVDRYSARDEPGGDDDFSQAGDLFRLMSEDQKTQLIENILTPLKTVPRFIQVRQLQLFFKADPDYGIRIADGLGIAHDEVDGFAPEKIIL